MVGDPRCRDKGTEGKISRNAVEADKQTFGERQAGKMGE